MNIYVASSWRNTIQPEIIKVLRDLGHIVYDFKHPEPGYTGFAWSQIDPDWKSWDPKKYREALQHPIAKRGYGFDITALKACDVCVLVLPSGRSASWEFGYAMGQGKRGVVVQFDAVEPELMYREAEIVTNVKELQEAFPPESYYVLIGSSSVFVKEAEFFKQQGGLIEPWGKKWVGPVQAPSIEAARAWGEQQRLAEAK